MTSAPTRRFIPKWRGLPFFACFSSDRSVVESPAVGGSRINGRLPESPYAPLADSRYVKHYDIFAPVPTRIQVCVSILGRARRAISRGQRCFTSIIVVSLVLSGCGDMATAPLSMDDLLRPRFLGGNACEIESTLEARMYYAAEQFMESDNWLGQEYGDSLYSHLENYLVDFSDNAFVGPQGQLALGTSNPGDGKIWVSRSTDRPPPAPQINPNNRSLGEMTRTAMHETIHLVTGSTNELLVEAEVSYCGMAQ